MEVVYASRKIQKVCDSLASMRRSLGDLRAQRLEARIQQLEEASCLEDLRHVAGDWHELGQNRKGQIAANIGHPYRLIIEPVADPLPTKPDGGLDWSQVVAVQIVEIVDYH